MRTCVTWCKRLAAPLAPAAGLPAAALSSLLLLLAHLPAAFSQPVWTARPTDYRLYARDLSSNRATVSFTGSMSSDGGSYSIRRFRTPSGQSEQYDGEVSVLPASGAISVQDELSAGLVNYRYALYRNGAFHSTIATDVVAGDAYVVYGQSNAESGSNDGSVNPGYQSNFIRGIGSRCASCSFDFSTWAVADGDQNTLKVGGIGVWPLILGRKLVDGYRVPVAIISYPLSGADINTLLPGVDPLNTATPWGRLMRKADASGVKASVRAVLYFQGESDVRRENARTYYRSKYDELYAALKAAFPSMAGIFNFQITPGCFTTLSVEERLAEALEVQQAQKEVSEQYADVHIISTNGIAKLSDFCHYGLAGNLEIASRAYERMRVLLYETGNGSVDVNESTPVPGKPYLSAGKVVVPLQPVGATYTMESNFGSRVRLYGTGSYTITSVALNGSRIEVSYTASGAAPTQVAIVGGISSLPPDLYTSGGVAPIAFKSSISTPAVWTGAVSADWGVPGNWSPAAVPAAGADVVIPAGVPVLPTLGANATVAGYAVESGRSLTLSGGARLTVTGDLSNDGSIVGDGTLVLAGAGAQALSGTGTIARLEVGNPTGVTIASGGHMQTVTGVLTLTANAVLTTNGNLTLRSDAVGTAAIAPLGSGAAIRGNVVAERYIPVNSTPPRTGRAWRLLAVPVGGTGTLRDFLMGGHAGIDLTVSANRNSQAVGRGTPITGHGMPDGAAAVAAGYDYLGVPNQVSGIRRYGPGAGGGSFLSSDVPDLSTPLVSADQGYLVYVRGDRRSDYGSSSSAGPTTLRISGPPRTGSRTVPVAPPAVSAFTLVGNPYPAVLDLGALYLSNTSVIEPVFHVWDANLSSSALHQGGYRTVTQGGSGWVSNLSGVTGPQYVESGAAFFVVPKAGATAVASLSIQESHKAVAGASTSAFSAGELAQPAGVGTLHIGLETMAEGAASPLVLNGVMLSCREDATVGGADPGDVAVASVLSGPPIWLGGVGRARVFEARPWPGVGGDTVALGVSLSTPGRYSLRFHPERMLRPGLSAVLVDRQSGREVPVPMDRRSEYGFSGGPSSQDTSRFSIVFLQQPLEPMPFLSLLAERRPDGVRLVWRSPADDGVAYSLERAADTERGAVVFERAGLGGSLNEYDWTDHQPLAGKSFYRVRAMDRYGRTRYSDWVAVSGYVSPQGWRVFPNPVGGGELRLQASGVVAGEYGYRLIDAAGRTLGRGRLSHPGGDRSHRVALPAGLPPGGYHLALDLGGGRSELVRLTLR